MRVTISPSIFYQNNLTGKIISLFSLYILTNIIEEESFNRFLNPNYIEKVNPVISIHKKIRIIQPFSVISYVYKINNL